MKWFLTNAGKLTSRVAAGVATTAIGTSFLLPHFFTEKYMAITGCYSRGELMVVPEVLRELVNEVQDDMNYTPRKKRSCKIFMLNGITTNVKGMMNMVKSNYVLGLPKTLLADSTVDFSIHKLQVGDSSIPWSSYEGNKFKETLLLTKDEKKYYIAETMRCAHLNASMFYTGSLLATMTSNNYMCYALNQKYNLYSKGLRYRLPMYALSTLAHALIACVSVGVITRTYEHEALTRTIAISPAYHKAAIEYYEKMLLRNIAWRKLVPKSSYLLQENGDETFIRRRLHLSVMERIKLLNNYEIIYITKSADL